MYHLSRFVAYLAAKMRHRSGAWGSVLALAVGLALLPADASAYIDPGNGALLFQALLSGFFGAVFIARHALRRIAVRVRSAVGLGTDSGAAAPRTPPDA